MNRMDRSGCFEAAEREAGVMKIRLIRDLGIPSMRAGMVFEVQTVVESRGDEVYFIHHAGNDLGISAGDCEVIGSVSVQEVGRGEL